MEIFVGVLLLNQVVLSALLVQAQLHLRQGYRREHRYAEIVDECLGMLKRDPR